MPCLNKHPPKSFQLSWKSEKRFFDPSCKTFLTNWGKNEDEDEKIRKNDLDFWILLSKLGYVAVFMKIWEKSFWLIF